MRWEQYNQSNLRSVFMLYDLKHQTTPLQLSPQLCNSILSKARRCCFTSRTSNCRSHLLLHNSPVDNNLGGHCQFGGCSVFLRDAREQLRSGSASLPETQPSGTQEFFCHRSFICQNERRAGARTGPAGYHLCSSFLQCFYFSTCFFMASPPCLPPFSLAHDSSTPFTRVHHHVCPGPRLIPLPKHQGKH